MAFSRPAKGQSLVIIALCLVALISLVALALDGGSALLQRRNMQNGADAAALGTIELMQNNLVVTCSPTPCHPTFLLTNQSVQDRATQLVTSNRGSVVGTATYSILTEYHIMAGAPAYADTYRAATAYTASEPVPPFVDGVRVTAGIGNPTTFARAININSVPVSAAAAGRLYGTCAPLNPDGDIVPMVRFRPTTEDFLANNPPNDACHLFEFWNAQGDFQQMKNLVSLNVYSFDQQGATQLLSGFDLRNGTSGGLVNYGSNSGRCPSDCADMRGSTNSNSTGAKQDVENWIYYQWMGQLSFTSLYPASSGTWAPANRTNSGGARGGSQTRPGDWIETYTSGNWGSNVSDPLYDAAMNGVNIPYYSTPVSQGGLGWGPAIDRKVYLWGPESIDSGSTTSDYAQEWQNHVTIPLCIVGTCRYTGWEDLTLGNSGGSYTARDDYHNGSVSIDRVRLTRAIRVRFFANLQGNRGGAQAPPGCSLPTLSNSRAWGLIMSQSVPGPVGGNCGWVAGGAVYSRLIDP